MPCLRSEFFRQLEATRLLKFIAEEVRGKLVRFVEHYEVPASSAEFLLQFFVPRHLVKTND